ncbi:MAG: ribosome-associated translation inhibitor RaiA [Chloroflexi bacterium]|nr:ribosome-associated translation inhibitor RaiA [Chloroflexota bacterium]
MEVIITGKNLEVTDWLYERVENKVSRLDRYLPGIEEARVELSVENTRSAKRRQRAQVTLRRKGIILRTEERSADIFTSVDAALDKMQRQIERYKGKRLERKGPREPEPIEMTEEEEPRIVRTKRFSMLPMTSGEAIEQMELLGHDFFVFFNTESDEINVLYRRKDGDYGLLQPEMA